MRIKSKKFGQDCQDKQAALEYLVRIEPKPVFEPSIRRLYVHSRYFRDVKRFSTDSPVTVH